MIFIEIHFFSHKLDDLIKMGIPLEGTDFTCKFKRLLKGIY